MHDRAASLHEGTEQEIIGSSVLDNILLLYDTGLRACGRRDRRLAVGVLVELMGAVDITHGEMATGLIRLYDYALREVRENRFDFAAELMRELGRAYRETAGRPPAARATAMS